MIAHALEVPESPCEVFHASQKRTLSELRTDPAKQKRAWNNKKKRRSRFAAFFTLFTKPTGRSCGPGSGFF